MKCLACGADVLELRGPTGRGMIVEAHPDGDLAQLSGRLRRLVDRDPGEVDGPYLALHAAKGLVHYLEHAPRCDHSLKPKTAHEVTTKPAIRLVGRERRR
jgi:hypothetical protein